MRVTAGARSIAATGRPDHGDVRGATTTSRLRAIVVGSPTSGRFARSRSISDRPADTKTSIGAPSAICRASAPEPPTL